MTFRAKEVISKDPYGNWTDISLITIITLHEKIAESNKVLLGEGPIPADKLKVSERTIGKEAFYSWQKPWNSPHGNSNYHRDLTYRDPQAKDFITDDSNKITY